MIPAVLSYPVSVEMVGGMSALAVHANKFSEIVMGDVGGIRMCVIFVMCGGCLSFDVECCVLVFVMGRMIIRLLLCW